MPRDVRRRARATDPAVPAVPVDAAAEAPARALEEERRGVALLGSEVVDRHQANGLRREDAATVGEQHLPEAVPVRERGDETSGSGREDRRLLPEAAVGER